MSIGLHIIKFWCLHERWWDERAQAQARARARAQAKSKRQKQRAINSKQSRLEERVENNSVQAQCTFRQGLDAE